MDELKYREREREREWTRFGRYFDKLEVSTGLPRSFRSCCLRGKNRRTGVCSFFNGKISKILEKLRMVL